MNRLNRKVEYALMALKYMARKRQGELTSAKEICEAMKIPFDPTARVLQQMGSRGLLQVEQGAHGGYLICKDLSKVSFHNLTEIILGPTGIAKCIQDAEGCDLYSSCNIHSPMNVLNKKLVEFYQSVSLAELLRAKEGANPTSERTA